MNTNNKKITLNTGRFKERMKEFTGAKNIVSGKMYSNIKEINVNSHETLVLVISQ